MALADPQRTEALDPFDPLQLADQLTEEERMIQGAARAYAEGELLPRVTSAFLEERFDREIMSEMGALGLLGATIDPEYGGAGLSYVSYGLIAENSFDTQRYSCFVCAVHRQNQTQPAALEFAHNAHSARRRRGSA